jgi:predicted MFS family arabinose efflux permease
MRLDTDGSSQPRPVHKRHASWLTVYLLITVMLTGTVPTPLLPVYAQRLHLTALMITVAFASYAATIVIVLWWLGGVSDEIGRLRVKTAAVVLAVASSVVLIFPTLPTLLIGRVLAGGAVALIAGAATAYLGEISLHRSRATVLAGVGNMLGLGAGALVGGIAGAPGPAQLWLPYAVTLLLLMPALAIPTLRETVHPIRALSLRPRGLHLPPSVRQPFTGAATSVFAAFAVLGLIAALTGTVLRSIDPGSGPALTGVVIFFGFAAAAAAQLAATRLTPQTGSDVAMASLIVGTILVALGVHIHLLAAIVAGMIIAGSGSGLAFRSGLTTLADACAQQLMGQVVSSYFAVAYLGLSIPVVGTGLLLTIYGPTVAVDSFTGFTCVVSAVSAVWSHAARPQR